MPSSSKKQHNFMAAIAHSPAFAKKAGVPQSVGRDFNEADKGKTFAKGGDIVNKLFKGKESYSEELKEAKAIKSGKITPQQYARGEKKEESMKKMASGGITSMPALNRKPSQPKPFAPSMAAPKMASGGFVRKADGIAQRGKTQATQIKMKSGGKC